MSDPQQRLTRGAGVKLDYRPAVLTCRDAGMAALLAHLSGNGTEVRIAFDDEMITLANLSKKPLVQVMDAECTGMGKGAQAVLEGKGRRNRLVHEEKTEVKRKKNSN